MKLILLHVFAKPHYHTALFCTHNHALYTTSKNTSLWLTKLFLSKFPTCKTKDHMFRNQYDTDITTWSPGTQ
jgi:hypothetical protein